MISSEPGSSDEAPEPTSMQLLHGLAKPTAVCIDIVQAMRNISLVDADTASSVHVKDAPEASTAEAPTAATPLPSSLSAASGPPVAPAAEHPFESEPGDHAETPLEAYQHIAPLLSRLARRLDKTAASLSIYDPYYCEGGMMRHMNQLGFESVYNRCEDFYAIQAAGQVPEYDILVTNPPFSGGEHQTAIAFRHSLCILLYRRE